MVVLYAVHLPARISEQGGICTHERPRRFLVSRRRSTCLLAQDAAPLRSFLSSQPAMAACSVGDLMLIDRWTASKIGVGQRRRDERQSSADEEILHVLQRRMPPCPDLPASSRAERQKTHEAFARLCGAGRREPTFFHAPCAERQFKSSLKKRVFIVQNSIFSKKGGNS